VPHLRPLARRVNRERDCRTWAGRRWK
jgi:hypothetical protein